LGAILTLRMTAATIAPILPERQGQVKPGSYEDDRRGSPGYSDPKVYESLPFRSSGPSLSAT